MGWARGLFRAARGKWEGTDFPEKIRNVLLCAFSNLKILPTSYPSDLQGPVHWLQDSFSSPYLSITITNPFIIILFIADTSVLIIYLLSSFITSDCSTIHLPYQNVSYLWIENISLKKKNPAEVKGITLSFPRQEYWNRLPLPSPGDLPKPGIESGSPAVQVVSLHSESLEKSQ